uniref:Uncharacterized protein n=1 Tax=Anguilla anguilla TaxID=7936 RepID=A0A0E9R4K5_ANGAN
MGSETLADECCRLLIFFYFKIVTVFMYEKCRHCSLVLDSVCKWYLQIGI